MGDYASTESSAPKSFEDMDYPTAGKMLDDTVDSTTLIGGSPLKNEIRPDSSCSNKADDGVPRPIYQVNEIKPPVQPKIRISVFAVQKDGRFLLGRAKKDDRISASKSEENTGFYAD
jgi:hypothetical protein